MPAALVAVAMVVVMAVGGAGWIGEVLWGQEVIGRAQFLALPLIGSVVAWYAARDSDGMLTVLPGFKERGRHAAATGAAGCFWLAVVYAVAHLVVVAAALFAPVTITNGSLWPWTTQTLTALATWWMGFVVGSSSGSIIAAPLVGGLTPVLLLVGRGRTLFTRLAELGSNGTLLGYRPDSAQFGSRVVLLSLLLAALVAAVLTSRRRFLTTAALALAAVGGQFVPTGDGYRLTQSRPTVCVGEKTRLCALQELEVLAEHWAPFINQVSAESVKLTSELPTTYWAWTADVDAQGKPWVTIFDPGSWRGEPDKSFMIEEITAPRSCAIWRGGSPPPDSWVAASWLVSDEVRVRLGMAPLYNVSDRLEPTDPNTQDRIVHDAAKSLATCDLNALPPELRSVRLRS
ncbi:hypothetical protein [Knoellia aerolata]|uniref:hypothetical protein n=1 Tax=Knoellia aerolata TaxID=442954 RepID=UPI001470699C|nr:hypothetical protein [Knoellia aerolata]